MRLSQWRATAPTKDAVTAKVAAVVDPVLLALGTGPDPHCWVAWGEEPASRFTVFVPTDPGLIVCFVRVNVPGDGPRATTKLARWNRVSIGELAVETQAGHRMLSFQLESQILRGVDAEADRAAAFALRVIAAIDGRPLPPDEPIDGGRKVARSSARTNTAKKAAGKAVGLASSALAKAAGTTPAKTAPGPAKRATARATAKPAAPRTAANARSNAHR